ncbi:MAG: hypothetical protein AB7E12_04180 [Burkholderiaceae bacterium]
MTSGDWIVVGIFGIGVLCSLSLLAWLVRTIKRDKRAGDKPQGMR